mmetsp:Transcript_13628/g.45424  ORF Transcript_13628/g.45424 Transcript_13628/m.45424 type:complete len:258 (-) Transcript_13628:46-819(-)
MTTSTRVASSQASARCDKSPKIWCSLKGKGATRRRLPSCCSGVCGWSGASSRTETSCGSRAAGSVDAQDASAAAASIERSALSGSRLAAFFGCRAKSAAGVASTAASSSARRRFDGSAAAAGASSVSACAGSDAGAPSSDGQSGHVSFRRFRASCSWYRALMTGSLTSGASLRPTALAGAVLVGFFETSFGPCALCNASSWATAGSREALAAEAAFIARDPKGRPATRRGRRDGRVPFADSSFGQASIGFSTGFQFF